MATTYNGRIFEVGDVIYFSKFGTSISNANYAPKSGTFGECYGTISKLWADSYYFPIQINGSVHAGTGGTFTGCTVKPADCTRGYQVKVTYNHNGGSGTASQTGYVGANLTGTSSRTGYQFAGWYTASSGGSKVTTLPADSTTLYAHWTANTYYVSFNGNSNTGGSTAKETFSYGTAKALTANGFTKTGYTFSKWNTKSDGTGTSYNNGQSVSNLTSTNGGTVTLYARWTANTYYVKFNGNGNTGGSTAQETFTYGVAKALTANGFTKTGYTFKGWATSTTRANAGTVDYTNQKSVSNLTSTAGGTVNLYAVWTANTFYVQFNGNGNTGGSTAKETFTYGTAKALTANGFTKTGYTFKGWSTTAARANAGTIDYTDKQSVSNLTSTSGGTYNVYASWQANTFYVAFNGNGSLSGSMSKETFTYDTYKNLTANAFGRGVAYKFNGWNTKADGTGTSYTNSQSVRNLTSTAGGTVTLYAQWELQYISPTISNVHVLRYEDGAEDDAGTQGHVEFDWAVDTIVSATNYATSVKVEYKEYGASTWTTLTETTYSSATSESQGGHFTYTSNSGVFDTDKSYNIRISISDSLGPTIGSSSPQATASDFLSKAFYTMDWAVGGHGVGIGIAAPEEGLHIGMLTTIYSQGETVINNSDVYMTIKRNDISGKIGQTIPEANTAFGAFRIMEMDGNSVAWIRAEKYATDAVVGQFAVRRKNTSDANISHVLTLAITAAGARTVTVSEQAPWLTGLGAVAKAGDTMTGNLTVSKAGAVIAIKNTSITVGTTPSSSIYGPYVSFQDSAGVALAAVGAQYINDGNLGAYLQGARSVNGTTVYNKLSLSVNSSGGRTVTVSDAAAWRTAIGAVNKAGDTITGKLIANGGLAIKSGSGQTAPPFFLCLNEAFANGGNVGYVMTSNMPRAIGMGYYWQYSGNLGNKSNKGTSWYQVYASGSTTFPAGTYFIALALPLAASQNTASAKIRIGTTDLLAVLTNSHTPAASTGGSYTDVNNITGFGKATLSAAVTGTINIVVQGQSADVTWQMLGYNTTSFFIMKLY